MDHWGGGQRARRRHGQPRTRELSSHRAHAARKLRCGRAVRGLDARRLCRAGPCGHGPQPGPCVGGGCQPRDRRCIVSHGSTRHGAVPSKHGVPMPTGMNARTHASASVLDTRVLPSQEWCCERGYCRADRCDVVPRALSLSLCRASHASHTPQSRVALTNRSRMLSWPKRRGFQCHRARRGRSR
jgi:hypothetical protein